MAATSLDTVNVTASRMAQTIDETLAAVTVITREDIDKSQAKDITQLLDGTQGLTMSNNGGLGKVAGIRLRGTDSKQVLVLIDGVRIGSATLGTTAFQDLPLSQIERIEVVRGPRSQLYGADAIGGVIQIFTRKG
ncbi:MAG: TonB-dependent receptor plug domain-containing protein, partial [Sedimenticola sp.]|nr:TonB-dependent receptor plug domain-containing protein [Sedimenticola sp.]